jgi:hypothetical protein
LAVTYNTAYANKLNAGSGLDWFWGNLRAGYDEPEADRFAQLM